MESDTHIMFRKCAMASKRHLPLLIWVFLCIGCAGNPLTPGAVVQPGDTVAVHYTCRLSNGEIIATTLASVAANPSQEKSSVFSPSDTYGAVSLRADPEGVEKDRTNPAYGRLVKLEDAIAAALQSQLAGLIKGGTHELTLAAEVPENLQAAGRYLKLAKIRRRPKKRRIPRHIYHEYFGPVPEVGWQEQSEQAFISTVTAVNEKEVVMDLRHNPNARYMTEYGEGGIVDKQDHFEIKLDVAQGQLIRNQDFIGRVVSVDQRHFRLDFGHPFGGETLQCELEVLDKPTKGEEER